MTYTKTKSGLSWITRAPGNGDVPQLGDIVSVAYQASLLSSGRVVDSSSEFSFVLGSTPIFERGREYAWGAPSRQSPLLPIFQEAMNGMLVGETRRINVLPNSEFATLPDETVQFELELIGVKTGVDVPVYWAGQVWKQVNIGPVFLTVLLLFFGPLPDVQRYLYSLLQRVITGERPDVFP